MPIYVTALTIDKDTSTPSINAGSPASYTIRLKNISNLAATNVSITDSLASSDFSYAAAVPATISFYNSSNTLISSSTATNDGFWGGGWSLAAGEYVVVQFNVNTANSTPPASYDSNADASFTWNGSASTIDDKGRVAQDSGTPDGEDPATRRRCADYFAAHQQEYLDTCGFRRWNGCLQNIHGKYWRRCDDRCRHKRCLTRRFQLLAAASVSITENSATRAGRLVGTG